MSDRPAAAAPRVAVVGCGAFGALAALRLDAAGFAVRVFERREDVLLGASFNNQNRLHLGFHYPRDEPTARQCERGFHRFAQTFASAVFRGFPNAYFIAAEGSRTSLAEFGAFADRIGLDFRPCDPGAFPVDVTGVEGGLLCDEAVYDCGVLRDLLRARLERSRVELCTGQTVSGIARDGELLVLILGDGSRETADAVVNASYADVNRLTAALGHPVPERQFEYTVVPIVEARLPRVGITIMDGPFATLLPFGASDRFLLYHVSHTVVATQVARRMDSAWLDPETAPFAAMDGASLFERIQSAATRFVPALADARCTGFLQGPRMVLSRSDDTDARPSIVEAYGDGRYLTLFSGKIDHCLEVADQVVARLAVTLGFRAPASSHS